MNSETDTDPVVQRVVSATDAPRPQTSGVSSVFAMAGTSAPAAPAAAPRVGRGITGIAARCVQALDACGPLNAAQLAEATGFSVAQARDACVNGCSRGYLGREKPALGGAMRYKALPGAVDRIRPAEAPVPNEQALQEERRERSGFKHWLEKKGRATAASPMPAPAPKKDKPGAPTDWRCGVYSDGAVVIEAKGHAPIELAAAQAKALTAFLLLVYPE